MRENIFSLFALIILVLSIGVGSLFFLPHRRSAREMTKPQSEIKTEEKSKPEQIDTFDKKYQVLRYYDEDVSFRGVPRYTRKIKIKLGLSAEELTANLIHAAWEMQEEKNAKAVKILAFRPDDIERAFFTAGECILAPFGLWAEATNTAANSVSNLKPVIHLAEVYFKDIPPLLKADTNVIINTPNTKLYRTRDIDPDDVIAHLKKGQRAVIAGSMRSFSSDKFHDFYMIQFIAKGKKKIIGWVFGNTLDEVQDTPPKKLQRKHKP